MDYTIWSNGRKYEWIISKGDEIVARSGLIFNSHYKASRGAIEWVDNLIKYINANIKMEEVK